MTEPEKTFDMTATPKRRLQLPRFWLILTGALILLNLITLGVGKFKEGQMRKAMKKADTAHAQQMKKREDAYQVQVKALIKREGETLARAIQMVNPQLLTDRGQEKALSYFQSLLADPNIEFIALFDANGTICATTNLRLMGKVSVPSGLTDMVVSKGGEFGAGVEFFGPITRSDGQSVGTVLIGMNFDAGKSIKVAKPAAAATEEEGNPVNSQPAPVATPVPEVQPTPPAPDTQPAVPETDGEVPISTN